MSVPLAASVFRASIAVAETTTVGAVDKVQAQVEATQAGQTRGLVVKSEIYFKDRCHSTEGARLQATLKDGTEIALNVVIQAMAPRQSSGPSGDEDSSPRAIGTNQTSPMGGNHTPPPNSGPQGADGNGPPGNFPAAAGPRLDERSQGAVGMKGITLDAQAADGRAATVISSNGKSVKLDDGTRLLLVVQEKKGEAAPQ